jgi:uncharacterized repeat protein (TIGR02543 family)
VGSATLYAVWTENAKYTVSYDGNGATGGAAPAPGVFYTGNAATAPGQGSLTRTGYTFTGWATSSNGPVVYTPGATFNMTGNITLYAVWLKDAEAPLATNPPANPPNNPPANPPATPPGNTTTTTTNTTNNTTTGGDTYYSYTNPVNNYAAPAPAAQATPIPDYEESFTRDDESGASGLEDDQAISIDNAETPLAPFGGMAWALVNLILALIGVALAIIMIIYAARRKRREREDDAYQDAYVDDESETQYHKRRKAWLVTAIVMGVAGIVLFLLTEDTSRTMVLLDGWTIVNAVILVVEAIGMTLAVRRGKESDDESSPMKANAM